MLLLKNQYFHFAFIAILFTSCTDDTEYEVVSIDEVLPQAQRDYDYSEDTLQKEETDLSPTQEQLLNVDPEIVFDKNNELKDRKSLFMPDRLGYSEKSEEYFQKDSISFHYIKWSFEDSLKTVNAFYNWLDCFGEKCKSIRLTDEINGSPEAFLIWVSNESIYYLGSDQNLNKNYWEDKLFGKDEIEWNIKMHQAVRGRIVWSLPTPEKENEEQ